MATNLGAVTAPYPVAELEAAIGKTQWAIHQAGQRTEDRRNRDVRGQRNVYLAMLGAALIALIAISAANLRMSGQSRLIPYILRTDAQGRILDAQVLTPKSLSDTFAAPNVIKGELESWIEDWRYVTSDIYATKTIGDKVFAMVGKNSGAKSWLMDWYRANDPVSRSRNVHVEATVKNVIPQSLNTYEIYWSERQTDLVGQTATVTKWRTVVMIALNPPKRPEDIIPNNRYGIFITSIQPPQKEAGE